MLGIALNKKSIQPLKWQIYEQIKDGILKGMLKSAEALPSTRELSFSLNVSRSTVCEAYDMLISQGFVISSQGAPTRVADGLYLEPDSELHSAEKLSEPVIKVDFSTGQPDLRLFPQYLWRQQLNKAADLIHFSEYGYTGPEGFRALRHEISSWLLRKRGIKAEPNSIFITGGATHALHLIAGLLCDKGSKILMEDPCHSGMLNTFIYKGCKVVPIPVDSQGIETEYLYEHSDAKAVYVTPSHQFPLGVVLQASRRAALIRFARKNDIYIIEDDYDSEFRYSGDPIPPLFSMSPDSVIYVGTFSKTIFPALRIGYVILPYKLHDEWRSLRTYADVQNPLFEQAALTLFIKERKLDSHILKMKRAYAERRLMLLSSLQQSFKKGVKAYGDTSGLHVAIEFKGIEFEEDFQSFCIKKGIYIVPLENHCIKKGIHKNKLLIGYGHMTPEEIKDGVRLLSDVISEYLKNK